jgi:hypothetical protein
MMGRVAGSVAQPVHAVVAAQQALYNIRTYSTLDALTAIDQATFDETINRDHATATVDGEPFTPVKYDVPLPTGVDECVLNGRQGDNIVLSTGDTYIRAPVGPSPLFECMRTIVSRVLLPKVFAIEAVLERTPSTTFVSGASASSRQSIVVQMPRSMHAVVLDWACIEYMDDLVCLRRCGCMQQLIVFQLKNVGRGLGDRSVHAMVDNCKSGFEDDITPDNIFTENLTSSFDVTHPMAPHVFGVHQVAEYGKIEMRDGAVNVWMIQEYPSRYSHMYYIKLSLLQLQEAAYEAEEKSRNKPQGQSPPTAGGAAAASAAAARVARQLVFEQTEVKAAKQVCVCCPYLHWCIFTQIQMYYNDKVSQVFYDMLIDTDICWLRQSFMDVFSILVRWRPEFSCTLRIEVDLSIYTTRIELPSLEFYRAWVDRNQPNIASLLQVMRARDDVAVEKRKRIKSVLYDVRL